MESKLITFTMSQTNKSYNVHVDILGVPFYHNTFYNHPNYEVVNISSYAVKERIIRNLEHYNNNLEDYKGLECKNYYRIQSPIELSLKNIKVCLHKHITCNRKVTNYLSRTNSLQGPSTISTYISEARLDLEILDTNASLSKINKIKSKVRTALEPANKLDLFAIGYIVPTRLYFYGHIDMQYLNYFDIVSIYNHVSDDL